MVTGLQIIVGQTQYASVVVVVSVSMGKHKHEGRACGNIMVRPYATE